MSINVIAEIGSNWVVKNSKNQLQDIIRAIEITAEQGATGVKFQFGLDKLYSRERTPEIWNKMQGLRFPVEALPQIHACAKAHNLQLWASIFDVELVNQVAPMLDGLKVASGDLTYDRMVDTIAHASHRCKIPMAISTGAAWREEILHALETALDNIPQRLILMTCVSEYPTRIENANLGLLLPFKKHVDELGYSDHTLDELSAQLAIAIGYTVFEKHFAPWQNDNSPDMSTSIVRDKLGKYIQALNVAYEVTRGKPKMLTWAEEKERLWARRGEDGLRPMEGAR